MTHKLFKPFKTIKMYIFHIKYLILIYSESIY